MNERKYLVDRVVTRRRILACLLLMFFIFILLSVRVAYIMVVKGPEYKAMATEQWTSRVKIDAKRGRILDTNYKELAISGNVYRVDLDLNTIKSYINTYNYDNPNNTIDMEYIAIKIGEALEMDSFEVLKKLESKLPNGKDMQSAILARRIEKEKVDKLKDLNITGVLVSSDTMRYYPNNDFLAHVLGVTNSDGKGLTGVEYVYNDVLQGKPGVRLVEIDRNSKDLAYTISEYSKPEVGKDVVLTIDENIQAFAEQAAKQALSDNGAKAVTIVVMNPKTGEVLALVNKPDYDLNNPRDKALTFEELQKTWRNRAVSDTFEPGSIFKIITAIAALEEGVVNESMSFSCGGSTVVGGRTIKCWRTSGHGSQNFSDIIKNSCNMGFIQLGQKLGKEKLQKYIDLFGFGNKSGIDLPGEASGIIKPLKSINDTDLATIAFGQTNTVNTMQFMAAFNAVANGGTWITPHILKEVSHIDEKGETIIDSKFSKGKEIRTVSEEQTAILRKFLERVVVEGSAKNTFIDGYHIAGKTGTAQKVINGVYGSGKYISSFVGMAPADNPQITLMVTIDEPNPGMYYAGLVAAPAAKQVFYNIFNYLGIKGDTSLEETTRSLLKDVIIPDVRGMSTGEAIDILKKEGLVYNIEGEGSFIVDVSPKPGYTIKEGDRVNLYLGNDTNYNKDIVLPDFTGYSKETAIAVLKKLNLTADFQGEGWITVQSVEPEAFVQEGAVIKFILNDEIGD
ncbi:stage V sporulation protein D [Alloiococcus sp. CFN-8]|uniref:stage V sporulation protein D n=1 Tax=Alloiococcus sp. CFN-8 TaxID=3416081 RepID=UPI003CF48B5A